MDNSPELIRTWGAAKETTPWTIDRRGSDLFGQQSPTYVHMLAHLGEKSRRQVRSVSNAGCPVDTPLAGNSDSSTWSVVFFE